MSFSRTAARPTPSAAANDETSSAAAAGAAVGMGATTATAGRAPHAQVARKPRVAEIMGGPKRRSQPPPPPTTTTAKTKKSLSTTSSHTKSNGSSETKAPAPTTSAAAAAGGGGDGGDDDDGDDDVNGGDHDDGPYIFQASRPKDAPQYRMAKSIFNHRGGIRMDMITGAMLQLGWTEEPDAESTSFNLQWALSAKHLQRDKLKPNQIINHLQGIGCVTTKIQLCKNLRTLTKTHCDTFFPRCYVVCESKEFDAFVKQYQSQAAISVLIKYANLAKQVAQPSSPDKKTSDTVYTPPTGSVPPLLTRAVATLALHATQSYIKKLRYSPLARDVSWKDSKSSSSSTTVSSSLPSATDENKPTVDDDKNGTTIAAPAAATGKTKAATKKAGTGGGVYRRSSDLSRMEWQAVVRCAESIRPHANKRNGEAKTEAAAPKSTAAPGVTTTTATTPSSNTDNETTAMLAYYAGVPTPESTTASTTTVPAALNTSSDPSSSSTSLPSPSLLPPPIVPMSPPTTDNSSPAMSPSATTPTTDGTTSPPKPLRQSSTTRTRRATGSTGATTGSGEASGVSPVPGPLFDDKLVTQVQSCLDELKDLDPQYYFNGEYNVWILKPGTQSRGRGIQVCDSLPKIVKEMRADVSGRWVIQKYLERPMSIYRKKFDIRQWVVVTQFGTTLRCWFYEDCYLRFSSQDFDLTDLSSGIHLTNNAIQAKLKDFDQLHEFGAKGNMWSMNQFAAWLEKTYGSIDARHDPLIESGGGDVDGFGEERKKYSIWHHKLRPKMRAIAQSVVETARDRIIPRSHSFEIYGLDFMFDENLQPWLLEVNSAPTLMHIAVDALVDTMCLDMLTVVLAEHHRMQCEDAAEAEKVKAEAAATAAATATSTTATSGGNSRSIQRGAGSPTNRAAKAAAKPAGAAAKKTLTTRTSSKTASSIAAPSLPSSSTPSAAPSNPPLTTATADSSPSSSSSPSTVSSSSTTTDSTTTTSSSSTTDAATSSSSSSSSTPAAAASTQTSSTAPIPTTSTMGALALPGSRFRLIYEHRLASRERASKTIARIREFKDAYRANRMALTQPGSQQRIPMGQAQHLL